MTRTTIGPLSLEVPPDWTLSTVILAGPADQLQLADEMLTTKTVRSFQSNLVATLERVATDATAEAYHRRQIDRLREAGVSRYDMKEPEWVTLQNGCLGLLTEQVIVGGTGERVRQMQLVCINDSIAHTIIASQLDGVPFEATRATFRKMLLSLS